jgi:hypothetical protein
MLFVRLQRTAQIAQYQLKQVDNSIRSLLPVPSGHRLYEIHPMSCLGSISRIDFGMDNRMERRSQMPCAIHQME